MRNADDADDQEFLKNTLSQAKSIPQSLEQTPGGIGLYVNANKTEFN